MPTVPRPLFLEKISSLPRHAVKALRTAEPASLLLILSAVAATALLSFSLRLPVGLHYWDLTMYLDAAYRIDHKQIPHIDFSVPFGPLSTYLYWVAQKLFPRAQPVLAAQLSYAVICLPLLATILADVRVRLHAFILAGLFFVLLFYPANFLPLLPDFENWGIDGYAIYNRQAGFLLYLLVAAMFWCRSSQKISAVSAIILTCLLYTKITAFCAGIGLVTYLWACGRINARNLAVIFATIVGSSIVLEILTGICSGYFKDIANLIAANAITANDLPFIDSENTNYGGAIERIYVAINFEMRTAIAIAIFLILALLNERASIVSAVTGFVKKPATALREILQIPSIAFLVVLLACVAVESQNHGSQAFAPLLPVLIWVSCVSGQHRLAQLVRYTAFALLIMILSSVADRTLRVIRTAISAPRIEVGGFDPYRVVTKATYLAQAKAWLQLYGAYPGAFEQFMSAGGRLESDRPYGGPTYLLSVGSAVRALRHLREFGDQFETIATLDFVDPFPLLLGSPPIPGLPVVLDPGRTVAPAELAMLNRSWLAADGILVPRCPQDNMRFSIAQLGKSALQGRKLISIDPCWDLYLKQPSAARGGPA